MTTLNLLSAAAAAPKHLDPLALFLQADIVVKVVMIGLILASVWVWTIIAAFSLRYRKVSAASHAYERDFWNASDIDAFQAQRGNGDIPSARVATAAIAEWRRSTGGKQLDREGTRQRLAQAMDSAIATEAEQLSERLNFLATVGSVAPFVGLFGTVWGIMNSFRGLANVQQATLAAVAPGIAEALVATAIGLFAAIPAVVAYNRYAHELDRLSSRFDSFIEEFSNILQRQAK